MAETLLAILFVTSSARGSNLVFRWPPFPSAPLRLSRALPEGQRNILEASYKRRVPSRSKLDLTSEIGSSLKDNSEISQYRNEYDEVFGYSSEFLAGILCPHTSMCHQKFELVVDDLAFIGHPVCADPDGSWKFKPEKTKLGSRGRDSRNRQMPQAVSTRRQSASPSRSSSMEKTVVTNHSTWLSTFHLVMVLDLPDPSSSATGNVSKYFDVMYEQAAFTIAAVLYQEQVLSNFVEQECDRLGSLKDDCIKKVIPFCDFSSRAMEASSLAPALKTLYDTIKSSSIGHISLNNVLVEIQLPPYLDILLRNDEDLDQVTFNDSDSEDFEAWGPEMKFGWRLPALVPWKSLLLLDASEDFDPLSDLRSPHLSSDDRDHVDGLIKFLETVNVTLSLADLASLLDWELESQVYPIVRWLVQHRRAKVIDVVHSGLKTVFTLPPKFDYRLSDFTLEFEKDFEGYHLPPLPQILSDISTAPANQTGNHFFALVVQSKDLIPTYHEVVVWMLKRDMLVTLHLRIRIVATAELKAHVRSEREKVKARKKTRRRSEGPTAERGSYKGGTAWLNLPPPLEERPIHRVPSVDSTRSKLSELVIESDEQDDLSGTEDYVKGLESSDGREDSGWETADDERYSSIISDPGRATPLQRRWLSAMSIGKDPHIARRFELLNQYFDGRRTDDEILYKAEITRRQLREVLHHYDEYLQTFLHPS
ncbi:hypothetical protein L218DRAFT_954822 [Marasmius fiardii PR-910]|nr:hypothetical protein L218DRAFT_954822 [Marasmius fiardii PR-910]